MSSVRLRSVVPEDADWVFEACQDAEIQRWTTVPRPYAREHAVAFVTRGIDEYALWVIESAGDGRPAGVISIHEIENGTASIGYWIAPQSRGRGFTTEAIRLVCAEIGRHRTELGVEVDTVTATIARDNRASRRAAEKAGFTVVEERLGPAVENLVPVQTCVFTVKI